MFQNTVVAMEGKIEDQKAYQLGQQVYNYRCYYCHGYSGDAKTLASRHVDPEPRDFTNKKILQPNVKEMEKAIRSGKNNTAMPAFENTLSDNEISDVIYFIQVAFINGYAKNAVYHSEANGWSEHQKKYGHSYPFVKGEISINTPDFKLSDKQRQGREIFMGACISCHEVIDPVESNEIWQPLAVSYPRSHSPFREPDFISGASVFSKHDEAVHVQGDEKQKKGYILFKENCAFCHANDRTGKNWIGLFLDPKPRDLTDKKYLNKHNINSLSKVIEMGVPDSSMPRWDRVLTRKQIELIATYILRKEGREKTENASYNIEDD